MSAVISMPPGQVLVQRPQPVHSHGKFEATTSSTKPLASIRMTFLASQPSRPGAPVVGHPLEQEPQIRQLEKSYASKKERSKLLVGLFIVVSVALSRVLVVQMSEMRLFVVCHFQKKWLGQGVLHKAGPEVKDGSVNIEVERNRERPASNRYRPLSLWVMV